MNYDEMVETINEVEIISAKVVKRRLSMDVTKNIAMSDVKKFFRLDVTFKHPMSKEFKLAFSYKPNALRRRFLKSLGLPVNFKSPRVRAAAKTKLDEALSEHGHLISEAALASPIILKNLQKRQRNGRERFKQKMVEKAVENVERCLSLLNKELGKVSAEGDTNSAKKIIRAVLQDCSKYMDREDLEEVWRDVVTEKVLDS